MNDSFFWIRSFRWIKWFSSKNSCNDSHTNWTVLDQDFSGFPQKPTTLGPWCTRHINTLLNSLVIWWTLKHKSLNLSSFIVIASKSSASAIFKTPPIVNHRWKSHDIRKSKNDNHFKFPLVQASLTLYANLIQHWLNRIIFLKKDYKKGLARQWGIKRQIWAWSKTLAKSKRKQNEVHIRLD